MGQFRGVVVLGKRTAYTTNQEPREHWDRVALRYLRYVHHTTLCFHICELTVSASGGCQQKPMRHFSKHSDPQNMTGRPGRQCRHADPLPDVSQSVMAQCRRRASPRKAAQPKPTRQIREGFGWAAGQPVRESAHAISGTSSPPPLATATVSRTISSSSLVGTTSTGVRDPSRETKVSVPRVRRFTPSSSSTPR